MKVDLQNIRTLFCTELRMVLRLDNSGTHVETRAVKRLIVLPFRVLRSDPETDFLAFSLPDAIAASLAA